MNNLFSPPSARNLRIHLLCIFGFFAVLIGATCASAADQSTLARRTAPPDLSPEIRGRAQQLLRLGVSQWHRAGYLGRGMKVAVLDSGFRGYREQLGKALPSRVVTHSFRRDGNLEAKDSQHGILCGEVVHALAPEAELLFANWEPDESEQFLQAARWARQQGARLISCSIIMPNWSDGEGGGSVHAALGRIFGDGTHAGDMLCFASAGNIAQRHWSGSYRAGDDGFQDWRSGHTGNVLTPWGDERASAELYWQPGADYDLFLYDRDSGREVGRSLARAGVERSSALIHVEHPWGHSYEVRVRQTRGPASTFHLVSLNADLQYATSPSSVCFPADGPEVIGVGAVDRAGHRQSYSACGPNSKTPKPDLVAPVPFASSWRSRSFGGTSAAAPQAAALAALCWSRHPDWTAAHVRQAMQAAAVDLNTPGPDAETGYGLLHVPADK